MKKLWATFNKYDVEIIMVKSNSKKLDGAHGMTYFTENQIYLADNMSERMLFRTLVHELTHFALYAYDKSADDANENIGLDNEEELCYLAELFIPEVYEQAKELTKSFAESA